ncbi:MAG: hypothetical protein ACT4P6_19590 [Gemmatimonadaceae bacterium]
MDLSARIIRVAAHLLPRERHEWARAMTAELAQIRGTPSRLQFALSCVRASLVAPRPPDVTMPRVATLTILAGVAACVGTTAYTLAAYPMATQTRGTWVKFVIILLGFLWVALAQPRALVPNQRVVRIGVMSGAALFLVVRLGLWFIESVRQVNFDDDAIGSLFMAVLLLGALISCSGIVAASERSFRAGVIAVLWAGMVTALLGFSFDLIGTVQGLNFESHLREVWPRSPAPDLQSFLRKHMGEHLAAAMNGLVALPVLAVLFGALGAAIGMKTRSARTPHAAG